ncbi:MAG TPA: radical SAM protein [Candidatus Omnitrophota bacterium]|nr:radical SAM protein [Candidatus Omnitrophota bacterium]HPT38988.1 radical SAM protein [Candidatus Omnitrophota bacterium]
MCYTIPALVEDVRQGVATISYFGERKEALCEFVSLSPGDYVYAQGGYVVERILPAQAQKTLKAWKDVFFQLRQLDAAQASLNDSDVSSDFRLQKILQRARNSIALSAQEALYILSLQDRRSQQLVQRTANYLRQQYHNNSCCVHGILEISNICARDCAYCGISSSSGALRYRMSQDQILAAAGEAVNKFGFKSLVLQSGEDSGYTLDELADTVKRIKQQFPVLVFVSFGEVGVEGLRQLYDAGARGLLLRFETSNPLLYKKLHPGYDLNSRLEHLKAAYQMGYLIITGALVGLPQATNEDLVNDIMLASSLHAEMFSFGPFLPHPSTKLADCPAPSEEDVLGALALARLMCAKKAKILITTAYETLSSSARQNGLMAGGNSIMLNVTPLKYRSLYTIYPNRAHDKQTIAVQVRQALAMLKEFGRGPTDLGA